MMSCFLLDVLQNVSYEILSGNAAKIHSSGLDITDIYITDCKHNAKSDSFFLLGTSQGDPLLLL